MHNNRKMQIRNNRNKIEMNRAFLQAHLQVKQQQHHHHHQFRLLTIFDSKCVSNCAKLCKLCAYRTPEQIDRRSACSILVHL